MTFYKVLNMDIVAGTGAVSGWIVVSEYFQRSASADGNLRNERHQIIRDTCRILSVLAAIMGSHRDEITQNGNRPIRFGFEGLAQNFLDHPLAQTVVVDRSEWCAFVEFIVTGVAVNSCR